MAPSNPFKRLLPYLMSGTFLTSGIFFGDLRQAQGQGLDHGLLPDTKSSAFFMDASAAHDTVKTDYRGRDSTRLAFYKASYTQAGQDIAEVPDTALTLWENLETLKNSGTLIGPGLTDYAARAGIYYGYAKTPPGVVGLWNGYYGAVQVTDDTSYSQNYVLLCMVHETLHGVQEVSNPDDSLTYWTIWDFQRACMSTEAAAQVSEYLLALEFYHDSIPGLMNESRNISPWTRERLLSAWGAAQTDSLPYNQDLANVGEKEFYAQLRSQWWLDFYNNWTLKRYITYLGNGWLKAPAGGGYDLAQAKESGYVSEEFNFTAGLDSLPSNMFGKNDRMRQAFAYAECMRLRKVFGEADSAYQAMICRLEEEKNPYLGVDMGAVQKKLADPKNTLDALEVMDYFAAELKKARQQPAPADTLKNRLKKLWP